MNEDDYCSRYTQPKKKNELCMQMGKRIVNS